MVYHYEFSIIGPYHVKNNIVCQDSHLVRTVNLPDSEETVMVAAVADGLGSAAFSDIGSCLAVSESVDHCVSFLEKNCHLFSKEDIIYDVMKESFRLAKKSIEIRAKKDGNDEKDYDTTLDLVIYAQGTVYFAHAGDSGILVYTEEGIYAPLTKQVRDDLGRVFPLCFEESWFFGRKKEKIASVLLCTDGIWDLFFPSLLRNEENPLYVAQAAFFMDPQDLGYGKESPEEIAIFMESYVRDIPENKVNDDKTVVVLCSDSVSVTKQPESYYARPDWAKIQAESQKKFLYEAYPHLYNPDGTLKEKKREENQRNM